MGNCQAAESAVVVIQHPDQKVVQRMYWSVTANVVMSSNPGYYVAHVVMIGSNNDGNKNQSENVNSATTTSMAVKKLKLLRPDESLVLGQVYRLISFEDVLKNFAGNKCVKLKEGRNLNVEWNKHQSSSTDLVKRYEMLNGAVRRHGGGGGGQWRPVLQSIAELGAA